MRRESEWVQGLADMASLVQGRLQAPGNLITRYGSIGAAQICLISSKKGVVGRMRNPCRVKGVSVMCGSARADSSGYAMEPVLPDSSEVKQYTRQKRKEENVWQKMVSQISKGIGLLALGLGLALVVSGPAEAARSGGRMGGMRSFSSYGSGGMGRSMGKMNGIGRSKSGAMVMGGPRSSVQTNAFFFSPFGFGFGYGYPMGGGLGSLLFWGVFAVIMLQVLRGVMDNGGDSIGEIGQGYDKFSVAKVQVGLLSNARDLQKDLERIASRADTSTARGLHFVLQETVLALMRNPDYCVYGYAKSGVENGPEAAESRFNKLSLQERGKFEKETMVNVGGIRSRSSGSGYGSRISELIVVTILVAVDGRMKLPKVNSRSSLNDALSTLGSIPAEDVLAVEVLWTPEEEGDYFTQEDLAMDYPMLNTL